METSTAPTSTPDLAPAGISVSDWKYRNRKTRRPCKHPYSFVEYARRLRGYGYTYQEISDEIEHKFGVKVPWRSVTDWCQYAWRVSG